MKNLILFTFIFCTGMVYGQTPQWVDANYRSDNFPLSSYLVGFAELTDVSKKEADADLQGLESVTKSKLIESVKVEVKSVSTSNVSDYNGEIDDYFNQKTTSQSNLQLIGLQTETYYDKKSKTAYAISYVNKMKMVEYYRSEIGKNMNEISNIISEGTIQLNEVRIKQAYKNGLSAYNKFFVIDESQKIMMAIGANGSLDTRRDEVTELNNEFNKFMNTVTSHKQMSIDDMGYIIASGLTKAQGDNHKNIYLSDFTYEQTGFTSEFSYKLQESIAQSLPIQQASSAYVIKGTYFYKGDAVVVDSKLIDTKSKRVVGRNSVQIPEANLIHKNIVVIPKDIESLKMLDNLSLTAKTTGAKGKAGLGLDKDLEVFATVNGEPMAGIPIEFINNNGGSVYCSTVTDKNGIATCKVKNITGEYKNQVIVAVLDVERFLSNPSSEFAQNQLENKGIPKASFKVTVLPSTIYVKADENNFGQSLDVKLIEPQVKESLAGYGFDFKDSNSGVDYVIKIRASSRKGGNVSGVYFAYVDVTISVYDTQLGKEIYKDSINNLKGGGGTFDQAGGKAYYKAAEQVKDKIVKIMVK